MIGKKNCILFLTGIIVGLLAVPNMVSAQPYLRTIDNFTVTTSDGSSYLNPFSGGLDQPRIGVMDIEGDGFPDLFALNPGGILKLYANIGTPPYQRIFPSPYDNLPLRSWFRFADLDGDGDDDLFTSGPGSEVLILHNIGTQATPVFADPVPFLQSDNSTIFTQQETVPTFVDIDNNGTLDLFAGNLDGSIAFYENTGTQTEPEMVKITDKFEDILVLSPARTLEENKDRSTQGVQHGASVLGFADLDNDNDLDMLFGDFFTKKLLHFENRGTPEIYDFDMEWIDTAFRPNGDDVQSIGFNQPVPGDMDNDGDIDVLISSLRPSASVLPVILYTNQGTVQEPVMRRQGTDISSEVDIGRFSTPAAIHDDSRNGILIGAEDGSLTYFENVGTEESTNWRLTRKYIIPNTSLSAPATGDIDGDGVAEILIGAADHLNGILKLYRIEGNSIVNYPWQLDTLRRAVNGNASPSLVDIDDDGDLDLFIGTRGGEIVFFRNIGTPTAPLFEQNTPPSPFDTRDFDKDSAPRFHDLDGDNDPDAIIGSRVTGGQSFDSLYFFINQNGTFVESPAYPPMAVAHNPVPMALDLPEGKFLFIGNRDGGLMAYRDTTAQPSGVNVPDISLPTLTVTPTVVAGQDRTAILQWKNLPDTETKFILINALGNPVFNTPLQGRSGILGLRLPPLSSGTYFYTITSDKMLNTGHVIILR